VGGLVQNAGGHNLAVLDDATDVDDRRPVGDRRGELHHDGRVVGALEVGKVPPRRGVVRLHALQRVRVHGAALDVEGAFLRGDGALDGGPGPEGVAHRAPRVLEVGAEERRARLAGLEARSGAGDLEVHDGLLVDEALDGVRVAVLGQLEGAVVGVEGRVVLAEADVAEWRGAPEVRLGRVGAVDLDVELGRDAESAATRELARIEESRMSGFTYAMLL
jgi:hypothetical protein